MAHQEEPRPPPAESADVAVAGGGFRQEAEWVEAEGEHQMPGEAGTGTGQRRFGARHRRVGEGHRQRMGQAGGNLNWEISDFRFGI